MLTGVLTWKKELAWLACQQSVPEEFCVVTYCDAATTLIILLNKKSVWGRQIDGIYKFDITSILLNLLLLLGLASFLLFVKFMMNLELIRTDLKMPIGLIDMLL